LDEDELLAAAAEVLLRRAAKRSAPSLTVAALYAHYREAHQASKSWEAMRVRLAPFLEAFGDRQVLSLEVIDWSNHAARRLATLVPGAKDGRFYDRRTVNSELGWVKAMLNWSVGQGRLKYNPLAGAKRSKVRKGRETSLRESDIARAMAACQKPEQVVMILAAADVGLRRGEILQLQHDWIDHEAKTLSLPGFVCKNGRGGTVPVTQRFLDAVAAMPRHIRHQQVLWSERSHGPYSRMTLDTWWRDIRERAGLQSAPGDKEVHLHDLRASCATNAVARGVKLTTVSKRVMRHASLRTTEIYLRGDVSDPEEMAQAAATFEAGIVRDQGKRRGPKRADVDFSAKDNTEHS